MTPRMDPTTNPVDTESSDALAVGAASDIPVRSGLRPPAYDRREETKAEAETKRQTRPRASRQEFCGRYFEQLETEYEALCPADYQHQHERQLADLRACSSARPTWETNHRLEHLIVNGLPAPLLQQRIQLERARLESLLGTTEAAPVLAKFESSATEDAEHDRTVALGLLCEVQRTRLVQSEFTRLRNRLTIVLLMAGAIFGSFIGNQLWGDAFRYLPPAAYAVLAGLMGGYFSVLLRLGALRWSSEQTANCHQVDRLFVNLVPALALAMFEGGMAALILYTVFLSGMVEGSVFPHFLPIESGGAWSLTSTWLWMAPSDSYGVAKLMVWATLAGFSERLVPDLLSSLTKDRLPTSQAAKLDTASELAQVPVKS